MIIVSCKLVKYYYYVHNSVGASNVNIRALDFYLKLEYGGVIRSFFLHLQADFIAGVSVGVMVVP